jgi:hypothetical protein
MKKVLMKMAITKMIIMIVIKIMNEMGTLLLVQNDEDNGDCGDKGNVDYATD